jgi:hypothetical protein
VEGSDEWNIEMPLVTEASEASMIGVKLRDRVMNEVVREEYGMKEDLETKIEKNMLRLFSHVERMDERRLTKAKGVCKDRGKWKAMISGISEMPVVNQASVGVALRRSSMSGMYEFKKNRI